MVVYNDTSINRAKRRQAFTITEFMVGLAVGMVVIVATLSISIFSAKSFTSMTNYVDLDANSRNALDKLTRDIRQVNRLISHSATELAFEDADGARLAYIYSPEAKTLKRVKGNSDETLLTSCDSLKFSIFQRGPIGGTHDQYPTADPSTCKLVEVSWKCSREVMGKKHNTESVQTAKIIIRKQ